MCGTPDGPATRANVRRNTAAPPGRHRRWRGVRDEAWRLLARHVPAGGAVAVCGPGNGHDLPLERLAERAGHLDLLDIDPDAARAAARRLPRALRARVRVRAVDVTDGLADDLVAAAAAGRVPAAAEVADRLAHIAAAPLGQPPYDVVVADLLYSQLLYPGLIDAGLDGPAADRLQQAVGQQLTDAVVARLTRAAPGGVTVHLDDMLGWWDGHEQPFGIDDVLAAVAQAGPDAALAMIATGNRPIGTDPRPALAGRIIETAFWRWPFARGVDYLVCATVARGGA